MKQEGQKAYVATIAVLVDSVSAPDAFTQIQTLLDAAEPVLDFRITRVAALQPEMDARITEGAYRDGEFEEGSAGAEPAVGSRVVWNDPDRGLSTGIYVVERASGCELGEDVGILSLVNEAGGHAEVLASEIAE